MRVYTALRIAKEILARKLGHEVTGGYVHDRWAYLTFDASSLGGDFRSTLEGAVNDSIADDRPITVSFDDAGRTVAVDGMGGAHPDSGVYVRSTAEVGSVRVLSELPWKRKRRLRLEVLAA